MRVCQSPGCGKPTPPKKRDGPQPSYCSTRCKERTAKRRQRERFLDDQARAAHNAPVFVTDRVLVVEQTDMNGDLLYAVIGRKLSFVSHSRSTVDRDVRNTFAEGETWDSVVKFIPDGYDPRTTLTAVGARTSHYERVASKR